MNSIFFKSLPWKHHCVIVARKARSIAVYPGCDVCNNCHGIHLWCRNWRIFVVFRKSRFWRILIVKNQMHVKCQSFSNNAKSWIPIWIIGIFLISSLKLFGLKSWKLYWSIYILWNFFFKSWSPGLEKCHMEKGSNWTQDYWEKTLFKSSKRPHTRSQESCNF